MLHKRFFLLMIGLLTVLLIMAGCGSSDGEGASAVTGGTDEGNSSEGTRQITISASNYTFDQEVYKVNQGDTVEIIFENIEGYHEAVIDGYDIKLTAQEPVTFVADQSGEFDLYCSLVCGPIDEHNSMRAMFIVE